MPPEPIPQENQPPPPLRAHKLRPLPSGIRIALYILGWLLVFVGLIGLVLPGIQGILCLILGASALSLVSDGLHRRLRPLFRRWPAGWRRLERLRRKLHSLLSKKDT